MQMLETPSLICRPSAIHGMGCFAARAIKADERIIEYVGVRISKEESRRQLESGNEYIFDVTESWDIDGNVEWNPARLINHSCSPNAEAQIDEERIWIVALKDIEAGEEITFNYNYELADYQDHPCRCGAPGCVGYMVAEEHFPQLRRLQDLRSRAEQAPDYF